MDDTTCTTAPVAATSDVHAEFVDFHGLKNIFGIGRSLGYLLIKRGEIESKVLRHRDNVKGKRLIVASSVRKFLSEQPSDVDPRLSELNRRAQKISAEKRKEAAVAARTGTPQEGSER